MALPKVTVNVDEQSLISTNTQIPFVPAVIMKTKSGPIGTIETLTSEAQFKALFGESDYTTPSAYAIQTYLRSYSYVLVTRIANKLTAKEGTGKMTFVSGENENQKTNVILTATTDYKTDLLNGKEIKLVYDGTELKLWLDVSAVTGKHTISIKENFTADSTSVIEFTEVMNKLINSINAAGLGFTLENKSADLEVMPSNAQFLEGFSLFFEEGDSGNNTVIDNAEVCKYIDLYDTNDRDIDVMVIPEYSNYIVTNYATALALKNNFEVLVSPEPEAQTIASVQAAVANYNTENRGSLSVYYPNVYYNGFVDNNGNKVAIPLSIAVLHTYARTDIQNKWGAPAGVSRGTLNLASGLVKSMSDEDITKLYDNTTPINSVNSISGRGLVVWGNKTATASSAFFDRINVARLVKYITKRAYVASYQYLFEPITSDLFSRFKMSLETVLDPIKSGSGLADYEVIVDDTINTEQTIASNQLNAIIRIKPQEVSEFINIDLTLTDTITVSVEE